MAVSPPPPDGETAERGLDERLDDVLNREQVVPVARFGHALARAREVAAGNYPQATLGTDRISPPISGWAIDDTVAAAISDIIRRHGQTGIHA